MLYHLKTNMYQWTARDPSSSHLATGFAGLQTQEHGRRDTETQRDKFSRYCIPGLRYRVVYGIQGTGFRVAKYHLLGLSKCKITKCDRKTRESKAHFYTILYYTIPYYTIPYYTILYHTIPYYTILPRLRKPLFGDPGLSGRLPHALLPSLWIHVSVYML